MKKKYNLTKKRKQLALDILQEYEATKGSRRYVDMLEVLAKKYFYNTDYISQMITIGRRLRREQAKMCEILSESKRKARKPHTCNYCGEVIPKGEIYNHAKLKADDLYEWKSHERCSFIASELWNYIDPDEGMTESDFQEGCQEFCKAFICPDCTNADIEADDCNLDKIYCADKIYEYLQTHDFKRAKDKRGWLGVWKCVPKEG